MHSKLFEYATAAAPKIAGGLMSFLLIMGSVAGCGAFSGTAHLGNTDQGAGEIQVEYEPPVQIPRTMVDQVGYNASSEKAVVFRGENIDRNFYVVESDSGNIVYTGEVLKGAFNSELDEYSSLGFFNELEKEGSYYIYTDAAGESYGFDIEKDIYSDIFNEACKKYYTDRDKIKTMENDADRDISSACKAADTLLLAYEMNAKAFSDKTGVPESGNGIPDILDEVRYEAEQLMQIRDEGNEKEEETASFASMMARLGYHYKEYDEAFSSDCVKAAERAWSVFKKSGSSSKNTASFNAAAQLYRATGKESYHAILDTFFQKEDFEQLFYSDEDIFIGAITYLSTNGEVDVERCEVLMKYLMNRSEEIARKASKSPYLVTDTSANGDFHSMLDDMRCLTITDHIIYNHEYTTIIENHAHYLMGMNPEGINYVTTDTERCYDTCQRPGIMDDTETNALFIFMMAVPSE